LTLPVLEPSWANLLEDCYSERHFTECVMLTIAILSVILLSAEYLYSLPVLEPSWGNLLDDCYSECHFTECIMMTNYSECYFTECLVPGLFARLGTFLGESFGTVRLRDIVVPMLPTKDERNQFFLQKQRKMFSKLSGSCLLPR
jgi:hypothetical protein